MELVIDVPCDVDDLKKDVMVTVVREPSKASTSPVILSFDKDIVDSNTNVTSDKQLPKAHGGATGNKDELSLVSNEEDGDDMPSVAAPELQLTLDLEEDDDEEEDDVDILVERRLSERLDDDEQLFSDLLLQFRKFPFLVSRIRKQLAQDLVVSPEDIRRLVKVARDVINVKNKFAYSVDVSKPLLRDLLESPLASLMSPWIKPIVYDRKTIYTDIANAEGRLYAAAAIDEQHHTEVPADFNKQIELEATCDSFPTHSRQKLSNISRVRRLHTLVRSAYSDNTAEYQKTVGKTPIPVRLQVKQVQYTSSGDLIPAVSFDIDSAFQAPCANAQSVDHQYSLSDRLEVLRICDNESLEKVLHNKDVKLESRVASGPVLDTVYDDGKVSLSGEIMPGENLCVIGFAVNARPQPVKASMKLGKNTPVLLQPGEVLKHENRDYIILNSDLNACLDAIIPSQLRVFEKHSHRFDAAFTFSDVNSILTPYGLDFDLVSKASADTIKSIITRNILNFLDDLQTSRKAFVQKHTNSKPDRSTTIDVLGPGQISKFFQNLPVRPLSDIECYLLVSSMPDHGALYFAAYVATKHHEADEPIAANTGPHAKTQDVPQLDLEMATMLLKNANTFFDQTASIKSKSESEADAEIAYQTETSVHNSKVISDKSFLNRTRVAFALRNQTPTGLSMTTQYQAEVSSVDAVEETYEVFTIPGDSRSQLSLEYTSQEYQRLLVSANNPYPNPSALFTTRPLIEIARSMVIMMNPKKLSFILTDIQLKHAVFDISRMYDELDDYQTAMRKYFRAHRDEAVTDPTQLKRRAKAQYMLSIGEESDVKTNVRAAIILARLLVELEAGRHSFKKLFAHGNRGSETVEYSEQSKIQFIVAVAGNSADLGKTGQLLKNYQSDNLKQVADITSLYYDRFCQLQHIQNMYKQAQDLALSIKTAQHLVQHQLHGFLHVLQGANTIHNDRTKGLLFRLQAYDVERHVLENQREKLYGDYQLLKQLQQDVDLAIRFTVTAMLVGAQDKFEQYLQQHDIDGRYNPTMDAENSFCNPAELCCGSIPFDPFEAVGLLHVAGSALAKFKRQLVPIRSVAVLRAGFDIVYNVRNSLPLHAAKTKPILSSVQQQNDYREVYAFDSKIDNVGSIEQLVLEVAKAGVHDHEWATHLSRTLINLADNEAGSNAVSKLQQLHLSLRKFVRLLVQNCLVRANTYRFNTVANPENGRDAFMYTGDIDMQQYKSTLQQMSLQASSPGLARSNMNYINSAMEPLFVQAHRNVGKFLVGYEFVNHPDDINEVQGHRQRGASFSQAQEILLGMLATELLAMLHFIEKQAAKTQNVLDEVLSSAAGFIESFIKWGLAQSELDRPFTAEERITIFGRLHDAKVPTSLEELDDDDGDEIDEESPEADPNEEFGLVDDDTRANIFSQEAEDD